MRSRVKINFGEKVRVLRRNLGYSQEEFAWRVGLDPTYISGIENGKRNPTLSAIEILAPALGMTISSLFEGCEDEPLDPNSFPKSR